MKNNTFLRARHQSTLSVRALILGTSSPVLLANHLVQVVAGAQADFLALKDTHASFNRDKSPDKSPCTQGHPGFIMTKS